MYRIKFLSALTITTICYFQSTYVYGMEPEEKHQNGVEEACYRLITKRELPENFFEAMQKHEQRSGTNPDYLPTLKQNEEQICLLLGIDCKITPIEEVNTNSSYTLSPLNNPDNLMDEVTESAFGDELNDFNTSFSQLRDKEKESLTTLKTEKETGKKERINISLKALNTSENTTKYSSVITLIKQTRDLWVSLYQGEENKSKSNDRPLHKAALLYGFQAREFANILKKEQPDIHQQADHIVKFPELCYTFAQQEKRSNIKQLFITAGLRVLELNESHFSPDELKTYRVNKDLEGKKIPITILLLKELNNIFETCKEPVDYLKKMSIVETNHPLQASIYYKLMSLYKRLFSQGTVYLPNLNGIKKIDKSGLESEVFNSGFQALTIYHQALTSNASPGKNRASKVTEEIKAIYYERVLSIIDRFEKWLPRELLKNEALTYKSFHKESYSFLAEFYVKKARALDAAEEIKAMYFEQVLSLMDRFDRLLPEEWSKDEKDTCKHFRKESCNYLANFYSKKTRTLSNKDLMNFTYAYNISMYCYQYICIKDDESGTFLEKTTSKDEFLSNKRKARIYSSYYIEYAKENIINLPDDVFEKILHMYMVAKETSPSDEVKHFPSLAALLAPLYAKKSEASYQRPEDKCKYLYEALKNYQAVPDDKMASEYGKCYLDMGRYIRSSLVKLFGADDELERFTHVVNLLERTLTDNLERTYVEKLKDSYMKASSSDLGDFNKMHSEEDGNTIDTRIDFGKPHSKDLSDTELSTTTDSEGN